MQCKSAPLSNTYLLEISNNPASLFGSKKIKDWNKVYGVTHPIEMTINKNIEYSKNGSLRYGGYTKFYNNEARDENREWSIKDI